MENTYPTFVYYDQENNQIVLFKAGENFQTYTFEFEHKTMILNFKDIETIPGRQNYLMLGTLDDED